MPDNPMAPSLAESWTESADHLVYEFKLREGLKFHNGDPFTAEDVKFSFLRYKSKILHERVREVEIVDPHRVRFHLHQPWPDFMTFYGTMATAAGWIVPKNYFEQVGDDGFRKHPIGLGPYKFVSHTPGVELVVEAYEEYWRKMPHVKRLVLKSVVDASTRMAMLKKGEVDVAYYLDAAHGEEVKRDPKLRLAFSGGIGNSATAFPRGPVGPQVPLARSAGAAGGQLCHRSPGHQRSGDVGGLHPDGEHHPARVRVRASHRTLPLRSGQGQAVVGRGRLSQWLRCGGSEPQVRPFSRAGRWWPIIWPRWASGSSCAPWSGRRFRRRRTPSNCVGSLFLAAARYGNAATRIEESVVSTGTFAWGGYPDIDELFRQQDVEIDRSKREAILHQIQQLMHERAMFAPIFVFVWPSGIGPRVQESGLWLIKPYPWAAPYEEVRLKQP